MHYIGKEVYKEKGRPYIVSREGRFGRVRRDGYYHFDRGEATSTSMWMIGLDGARMRISVLLSMNYAEED